MKRVVGFGEIMGRLMPEGWQRLAQAIPGSLNFTFGGAESNVCASIALLGGQCAFVTALPDNPLGEACISFLRSLKVDTSGIVSSREGRLGLYLVEAGANQRASNVVYDRAGSAVAVTPGEDYNWDTIFSASSWFHITGITPSLSRTAAEASLMAMRKAKEHGLTVSCDLNFRKKLWNWESSLKPRDLAERTMCGLLPFVDLLIANEEDAADVLGIRAGESDVEAGRLETERYPEVAAQIVARFPNISRVAITLRESLSASHNNWGGMLYEAATKKPFYAPLEDGCYKPYEIRNIVDRVGGGDAFAAGLIYALMDEALMEAEKAIAFAAAASCLAHSISGDVNYVTRREVEMLMKGSASGRVIR